MYGVFGVREGRGIRLCRTRYHLSRRGVRIPGNHPRLERGWTRVMPSAVLRRRKRSATANGTCFGVLSPPRLRGRCRPSPVTGRGTVRTANESQPRTPYGVCRWWAWNRPYQRGATPSLPSESLRELSYHTIRRRLRDNVGCRGFVRFIPALKHGGFSSNFRDFCDHRRAVCVRYSVYLSCLEEWASQRFRVAKSIRSPRCEYCKTNVRRQSPPRCCRGDATNRQLQTQAIRWVARSRKIK